MARHLLAVSGLGSPTAAPFIAKVNAALSSLLDKVLISAQFVITDKLPAYTRQIQAVIEYEDGGTVMAAPFQVAVLESTDEVTLVANGAQYFAANPTSFIAPIQFRYTDQLPNLATRYISIYFSNTDSANAATNYQVNGSSGGGGGSALLATQVGYGSGANLLTGSYDLTWSGTELYVNGSMALQNVTVTALSYPGQSVLQMQPTIAGDISTLRIVPGSASNLSSFEFLTNVSLTNGSRFLGVADNTQKCIASDRVGSGTATPMVFRAVNGDWGTGLNAIVIGTNGYTAIYQSNGSPVNPNYPFQVGNNGSEWLSMDPTGAFTFNPAGTKGAGVTNLIVRASAGQTANTQEWQQASGFVGSALGPDAATLTMDGGSGTLPALAFISSEKRIYLFGPDGTSNTIHGFSFGSNFGNEVALNLFGRNVGGTRAAPAATADTGALLSLRGSGWSGVGTIGATGSRIVYAMIADGLWSASNNGTFHQWRDTTFGGTGTAESMRLQRKTLMVGTQTRGLVSKLMLNTPTTTDDLTIAQIATGATTSKGLVIQAVASQSANLQEWQISSGAVRVFVGPDGVLSANRSGVATNEIFGSGAGNATLTGTNNTLLGVTVGAALTVGSNNVAVGYTALQSATFSEENVAVGAYANTAIVGDNTGPNSNPGRNTAVGFSALKINTGGFSDAYGYNALLNSTTGTNNTALGYRAQQENTTGNSNTAVGQHALRFNTTGTQNTALGAQALRVGSAISQNTAVGHWAGFNVTSNENVMVGFFAARDLTSGSRVCIIGARAGSNTSFSATTGDDNVYIGWQSGYAGSVTSASRNTAVGSQTLSNITTATDNVAVGFNAGSSLSGGTFNTFVGDLSGTNGSQYASATNSMALGYAAFTTTDNQVVLGNASVTQTVLRGFVNYGTQSTAVSAAITAPRVKFTGSTAAQALTLAAGIEGTDVFVRNAASVAVDIVASGGNTIEGAATLTLAAGAAVILSFIGSDWTSF